MQNVEAIAEFIDDFTTPFKEEREIVVLVEKLLPLSTTMMETHVETIQDAAEPTEGEPRHQRFLFFLAIVVELESIIGHVKQVLFGVHEGLVEVVVAARQRILQQEAFEQLQLDADPPHLELELHEGDGVLLAVVDDGLEGQQTLLVDVADLAVYELPVGAAALQEGQRRFDLRAVASRLEDALYVAAQTVLVVVLHADVEVGRNAPLQLLVVQPEEGCFDAEQHHA